MAEQEVQVSKRRSVFHSGELAIQSRLGVVDSMDSIGHERIRRHMPEQHREFFANLPFLVLGALDSAGHPWVTAAFGPPGFISSPDERTLHVGRSAMLKEQLNLDLRPAAKLGAIGIDPLKGRRNRVNGTIRASSDDGLLIAVEQSFGNCARHIHRRAPKWSLTSKPAAGSASIEITDHFTADAQKFIARADTFFIASRTQRITSNPNTGIDVSHRGGSAGFLEVLRDGRLRFPDYSGNKFFNTLGNIHDDGRVGLLFPDVGSNSAMLLTGHATINWNAGRSIDVAPHRIVFIRKWSSQAPE